MFNPISIDCGGGVIPKLQTLFPLLFNIYIISTLIILDYILWLMAIQVRLSLSAGCLAWKIPSLIQSYQDLDLGIFYLWPWVRLDFLIQEWCAIWILFIDLHLLLDDDREGFCTASSDSCSLPSLQEPLQTVTHALIIPRLDYLYWILHRTFLEDTFLIGSEFSSTGSYRHTGQLWPYLVTHTMSIWTAELVASRCNSRHCLWLIKPYMHRAQVPA